MYVLATLVLDAPALDAAPRGTGVLVAPGTYSAVVTARSWIGSSTFTRTIVVKAP